MFFLDSLSGWSRSTLFEESDDPFLVIVGSSSVPCDHWGIVVFSKSPDIEFRVSADVDNVEVSSTRIVLLVVVIECPDLVFGTFVQVLDSDVTWILLFGVSGQILIGLDVSKPQLVLLVDQSFNLELI